MCSRSRHSKKRKISKSSPVRFARASRDSMRLVSLALIAVVLGAQEARFAVGESELKYLYSPAPAEQAPLIVGLPGSMEDGAARSLFDHWQPLTAARGWNLVIPLIAGVSDQAVKALELTLADAKKRLPAIDETRTYLAGPGASAAEVFYR